MTRKINDLVGDKCDQEPGRPAAVAPPHYLPPPADSFGAFSPRKLIQFDLSSMTLLGIVGQELSPAQLGSS